MRKAILRKTGGRNKASGLARSAGSEDQIQGFAATLRFVMQWPEQPCLSQSLSPPSLLFALDPSARDAVHRFADPPPSTITGGSYAKIRDLPEQNC